MHLYSLLFSDGLKLCTCIPFCSVAFVAVEESSGSWSSGAI